MCPCLLVVVERGKTSGLEPEGVQSQSSMGTGVSTAELLEWEEERLNVTALCWCSPDISLISDG